MRSDKRYSVVRVSVPAACIMTEQEVFTKIRSDKGYRAVMVSAPAACIITEQY